jgi:hypothetical protein
LHADNAAHRKNGKQSVNNGGYPIDLQRKTTGLAIKRKNFLHSPAHVKEISKGLPPAMTF